MSANLRIPQGGTILVTGANGLIASQMVAHLIKQNYKVRGTVRDTKKYAWMTEHFGPNLTLVQVPDLAVPNALDEVIKGVDGIAHVAVNLVFSADAKAYIPPIVQSTINILESAAKEPSVKSVVYTSSQAACFLPEPGKKYTVTRDMWNESAIEAAYDPNATPDFKQMLITYCAAKTLSEKGAFEWVEKNKPHFTFNSVLPNVNFGTVPSIQNQGFRNSAGLMKSVFEGNPMGTQIIPPEWYVDIEDTALVHIGALIYDDVKDERLFAFGEPFNWNLVLDIFRKICPDRKFLEGVPNNEPFMGTAPTERAAELLKRLGKPGFTSLEDGVRKGVEQILAAEKMEGIPMNEMDRLAAMG